MTARRPALLLASSLAAFGPGPGVGRAVAQERAAHAARVAPACPATDESCSPLHRAVALRLSRVPLGEALARLGQAADVRISFSADRVPLGRRVSLPGLPTTLGDALASVLGGTGVGVAVATGGTVVLTPAHGGAVASVAPDDSAAAHGAQALTRVVVVTGGGPDDRAHDPTAVTVITREDLERRQVTQLSEVFRAAVPGAAGWATGPAGSALRFGSLRGASSFSLSYPKVYVDGAEVASPLHVAAVDVASVERVEIIRGPQGAALFGSDAIGGVVHIITDKGRMAPGRRLRARLSTAAGVVEGEPGRGAPPLQAHSVSVKGGGGSWAFNAGGNGYAVGPWARDAGGSGLGARLGARVTRGRFVIDGSALHASQHGATGAMGLGGGDGAVEEQELRHTVASVAMRWQPGTRVTHALTVGVDRQLVGDFVDVRMLPATPEDSALHAARGVLFRRALRYAATIALPAWRLVTGAVTLGAEQATIAREIPGDLEGGRHRSGSGGVLAQAALVARGGVHVSAGLRAERHEDFGARRGVEALPMVGVAVVRGVGALEMTGRVSYGRGIRAPSPTAAGAMRTAGAVQLANPLLGPESQRGVEAGLEVRAGQRASLQLTRYDQVAEGLVQRVPVAPGCAARACTVASEGTPVFQQQNVGVIANRGWELQGALRSGSVGLWGTVAITDSRVRRLSPGYGGDLRAGDRPLGVARRAASATIALPAGPAHLAVSATHLGPRVDYDRHALRDAVSLPPGGTRTFWRNHAPSTELAASVTVPLAPGRRVLLKVDDVFDRRAAARELLGTTPGRTTMAVLQLGF